MGIDTITRTGFRDDDRGDGSADFWDQADAQMQPEIERADYTMRDVGRRAILAGRDTITGLDSNFHTDRVMPRRLIAPRRFATAALKHTMIGPDYYLG
jgi:hypothetical protein